MISPPGKAQSLERLNRALDALSHLKQLSHGSQEFQRWWRNTQVAIARTFGEDSAHRRSFNQIRYGPFMYVSGMSESDYQQPYLSGLSSAESLIRSMIDEIEEYWTEDEGSTPIGTRAGSESTISERVFIIHGHDAAARDSVARCLQSLELAPIVLHEQPNRGRTIIEKFEEFADVGFAVVVLTPDDIGAANGDSNSLRPRARQNVILELGFFIGKLGRSKVCVLKKGDVETPSDYDGVVYTTLDEAGGWRTKLVGELQAAGFNVDANRLV